MNPLGAGGHINADLNCKSGFLGEVGCQAVMNVCMCIFAWGIVGDISQGIMSHLRGLFPRTGGKLTHWFKRTLYIGEISKRVHAYPFR